MNKQICEALTTDQITDAKCLCDVISAVPNGKRQVFELVMLAYLNGLECGEAISMDRKRLEISHN